MIKPLDYSESFERDEEGCIIRPIWEFFADNEEVNDENWTDNLDDYSDGDGNQYTEEELNKLDDKGIAEGSLLADLLLGKMDSVKLSDLPEGTVIQYDTPYRQNAENSQYQVSEVRPGVKKGIKSLRNDPGLVNLLQVTKTAWDTNFDVRVSRAMDIEALGLDQASTVRCAHICQEKANYRVKSEDVLGCVNNFHSQRIWNRIKQKCEELPADKITKYAQRTTNETAATNQVIAFVVMS